LIFPRHRLRRALAAAALGLASLAASAAALAANEANGPHAARGASGAFEFVALGDMPYGPDAMTGPAYRRLIEQINDEKPVFSIHVGDFKDGVTSCTDELFARQHEHFQRFDGPLIFTPGDNDWTDCNRTGEDPLERLQALRALFYPADDAGRSVLSLGRRPMPMESQSRVMPTFGRYRENLRWWHGDVLFTTFHTVGPNNNSDAAAAALRGEYLARESANAAWIRASFRLARERGAKALVFATQADMFRRVDSRLPLRLRGGFRTSIDSALVPQAVASGLPVLLVHGDSHHFITDQPFVDRAGRTIANLWRLEVFGAPRAHAVKVRVEPGAAAPFTYTPIWNAMSADPRR
jgi:hypothetical protein